jgi:hypothetical protein
MLRLILLVLLLAVVPVAAATRSSDTPRIRAYVVVEPVTQRDRVTGSVDRLVVEAYGRRFDLVLEPNRPLLDDLDPSTRTRATAVGEFYRGGIADITDSWARMARINGRWTGAWFDGTELYLLDPADALAGLLATAAPQGSDLVYRFSDLDLRGMCAVDSVSPHYRAKFATPPRYQAFAQHLAATTGAAAKAAVRQLRVTLVTDTEFTGIHGVANRDAVVLARMAVVDGIYSNQVGTQIGIRHVEHLAANGTLDTNIGTGNDGLLNRFRLYMTSGAGSGIPKGGLNHLLTGKDIAIAGTPPNFGLAGIAYVNVLCSASFGYGLDEMRANNNTASLILAHEMGHNFDSPHDGNDGSSDQRCLGQAGAWLMSPSINGSSTFSPCTRTIVEAAINAAPGSCFIAPSGLDLIFGNGFEP